MTTATIGQALKDARIKKELSYEEIHAKIKIHPRVLQLMEEGKFDKLPSPLFIKSFLRSYAIFLELDPNEIVDIFEKEGKVEAVPEQVLFIRTVDEKHEASRVYKGLILGTAVVALLVIGVFALSFLSKKVSGWGHKTQVHSKGKSSAVVSKKIAVKKDASWARSVSQGNFPKIKDKTPLELRLRALDNVWVRVMADGKVVYQGIAGRGTVETWTAKQVVELWTGNAANMFLSLNKYALGSPGKGTIKKMLITREGVKIAPSENS